jgi:hypothetical protein
LSLFPKLTGSGRDDYKGSYTITSDGITKLGSKNSAQVRYDSGLVTDISYELNQGTTAAEFSLSGSFTDSLGGASGSFSMKAKVNTQPITGYCPNSGKTSPEAWLYSWPRRKTCPYPSNSVNCDVSMDICDGWKKGNKRLLKSGAYKWTPHYGFSIKVSVPEKYWSPKGWTVAIRLPAGQKRANFNVWNAQFLGVYNTQTETVLVITQRWSTQGDTVDSHSFMLTVDYLSTPDKPSILFWPTRNRRPECYRDSNSGFSRSGSRSEQELEEAITRSKGVKSLDDVSSIKIRSGKISSVRAK